VDNDTARARTATWWCVYLVDIWDSARRGRPAGIHEQSYDVPLPPMGITPTDEGIFFFRLVGLTRILSRVLTFGFNNVASTLPTLDFNAEETVRELRTELAEWYRLETLPRTSPLGQNIYIAYLTVVILLHRPLLPSPLVNAFADPILLLVSKCASSISHFATLGADFGSVAWRLYVPAVGYLTAGITLAQNAVWSTHIVGANTLRQSAQRDLAKLLEVFDVAEAKGQNTAGMSGLLRSILQRSGVELKVAEVVVPEVGGMGLPMPHEDPGFFASRVRPSPEQAMSLPEKRLSGSMLQPLAPVSLPGHRSQSLSDVPRKRKHSQISHVDSPSRPVQQLPSLVANLAGLEAGRPSPTFRSGQSISTFSSHSSNSLGRGLQPPYPAVASTAFHPSYTGSERDPHMSRVLTRQWEQTRAVSPQTLPPLYDRRYSAEQPTYPTRDHPPPPNAYYPDRREEFYPRTGSPYRGYPHHEQPANSTYPRTGFPPTADPAFHRPPDPRYRVPTPPLSNATTSSPSWPSGYPYVSGQGRYETTSPRTMQVVPPPAAGRWTGREEYYYPPRS
jgi:hypothetical protein